MVKNLHFLFCFGLFLSFPCLIQGQVLDFKFSEGEGKQIFSLEKKYQEVVIEGELENLTDESLTIRWEKIENNPSVSWDLAVCDPIACHFPSQSEGLFTMAPREIVNMDMHLFPNGASGDSVSARIKIIPEGMNDTLFATFHFYEQQILSNTEREVLSKSDILIYPNPTADYFRVNSSKRISNIKIFDILGKRVDDIHLNPTPSAFVNIAHLRQGMYVVSVIDEYGNVLKTQRLKKEF